MTSYCSICESAIVVGCIIKRTIYEDRVDIVEYRCEKHLHDDVKVDVDNKQKIRF